MTTLNEGKQKVHSTLARVCIIGDLATQGMRCVCLFVSILVFAGCSSSPKHALRLTQFSRATFVFAGEETYSTSEAHTIQEVVALLARQNWKEYSVTTPSGFSGCWIYLYGKEERAGSIMLYDRSSKLSLFLEISGSMYVAELSEPDTALLKHDLNIRLPSPITHS